MGLTRADLERNLSEQDRAEITAWLERAQANDLWAKKALFEKVGILLTSHPANRPYLKKSIETHKKLGYWITLAYDNYFIPGDHTIDYNSQMPARDVMDQVDLFLMPHHQTWGGPLYPYAWLLHWGALAMQRFEYIYCANGDFILEKPEGFPELLAMMGDADVMTSGPDRDDPPTANTAGFIIKAPALLKVCQHVMDHLVPFEVYEKWTQEIGNMEGRFGRAIKDLGLKQVRVDPPQEDMLKVPGHGTWYKTLGFRHVHSEHNHAYRNQGIPPHPDLLDPRFMGDEYRLIREYHETGNVEILKDWWAKA